jgi:hypothetical protein
MELVSWSIASSKVKLVSVLNYAPCYEGRRVNIVAHELLASVLDGSWRLVLRFCRVIPGKKVDCNHWIKG